jgi:broad-specificity NMP kinase
LLNEPLHNKEKINQALGECVAWQASLNSLKEESYTLKTTLSEMLDNNTTDKELIALAENFHNLIIEKDEYIKEIAIDAKRQQKKLKELLSAKNIDKTWQTQQQKLRTKIICLEKNFYKMREDFYKKILKKG